MVKNPQAKQETQGRSLDWDDPLEEEMATCSSVLPEEFHGQRNLAGYSTWVCKELDVPERLSTHT